MSIIRVIEGKQVLPVRALPYITRRQLSPQSLADALLNRDEKRRGIRERRGLIAYKLNDNDQAIPYAAEEWKHVLEKLNTLENVLRAKEKQPGHVEDENYEEWLVESIKRLPEKAFVFLDDFEPWFKKFATKLSADGKHKPEHFELTFDPDIDEIRDLLQFWLLYKESAPAAEIFWFDKIIKNIESNRAEQKIEIWRDKTNRLTIPFEELWFSLACDPIYGGGGNNLRERVYTVIEDIGTRYASEDIKALRYEYSWKPCKTNHHLALAYAFVFGLNIPRYEDSDATKKLSEDWTIKKLVEHWHNAVFYIRLDELKKALREKGYPPIARYFEQPPDITFESFDFSTPKLGLDNQGQITTPQAPTTTADNPEQPNTQAPSPSVNADPATLEPNKPNQGHEATPEAATTIADNPEQPATQNPEPTANTEPLDKPESNFFDPKRDKFSCKIKFIYLYFL